MKVASAQVAATQPAAALAESAVRRAMHKADLSQAASVLLFLSRDMAHCAKAAIVAAARVANCLQVHGCTAYGMFTEEGWILEQSGAVALVMDHPLSAHGDDAIALSLTGSSTLPPAWRTGQRRFGLLDSNATVWANGHISELQRAEIALGNLNSHQSIVTGLHLLGPSLRIDEASGYNVDRISGQRAIDSLLRCLPAEHRERPPLHRMVVLRRPGEPGIPILSSNADGSVTLGECMTPGEPLIWAMRQTLHAEKFMREAMAVAVDALPKPDFGLMFSCIGRGPLFYGEDDLDLRALRDHFPGLPLIGAYGSGQIASLGTDNLFYQNTAMTLLLEARHV